MMGRYSGRIITKNPVVPSGPSPVNAAPGIWTLPEVTYWNQQGRWPSASADPYWSYVSFLLGTTATNTQQNNTFLDSSTNNFTITRNGNTTQGTFSPYDTLWSNYFDGNGDTLAVSAATALDLASSDFTIEGWAFPGTQTNVVDAVFGYGVYTTMLYRNGTTWTWEVGNGSSANYFTITATCTPNAWQHFALTRSGNTFTFWINGVSAGTNTTANAVGTSGKNLAIGYNNSSTQSFTGYISNFRIVKGTAVYTAAFTPPAAPLTAVSGTSLLTCQSNRFRDASTNNFAITRNGDTRVSSFSPFVLAPPGYTTSVNGGSGYFDGTGDYLTLPSSDLYRVDLGDWTMEAWLYPTSTGVQHTVMNRGVYLSTYSFYFGTNGTSIYYEAGTGGWAATPYTSSSGAIIAGQWNHIAVVRSGTSLLMYANGNRVLNQASASFGANVTAPLWVGAYLSGSAVVNGNMTDVRFTQGTALYTGATYTVPTAPLTPSANTSLLLNFTNAGTYDAAMQNNLETVGNAQVSNAQAKYGTTSAYFDGSGDYLSMPSSPSLILGSSNFTAEAWFYAPSTVSSTQHIMGSWDGSSTLSWTVGLGATNKVLFVISTTGSYNPAFDIISTATFSTGAWNHLAFVRNGSAFNLYLNGVSVASLTNSSALYSYPQGTKIGGNTNSQWFNGYLDDVRITNGVARYTANFTPPTAALPVY